MVQWVQESVLRERVGISSQLAVDDFEVVHVTHVRKSRLVNGNGAIGCTFQFKGCRPIGVKCHTLVEVVEVGVEYGAREWGG